MFWGYSRLYYTVYLEWFSGIFSFSYDRGYKGMLAAADHLKNTVPSFVIWG